MQSHRRRFLRQAAAFRPRLECLERRDCPSCTVFQKEQTLFVLGDGSVNQIDIADTREGEVAVTCDGSVTQFFPGVGQIVLETYGGDDSIAADMVDRPERNLSFRADLGEGDDRLDIDWDPRASHTSEARERLVTFDIVAEAGNDSVSVNFTDTPDPNFQFRADLGAGNDRFAFLYTRLAGDGSVRIETPEVEEEEQYVFMEIAAGSGDDVVTADFAASPDPDLWFRADLGSGNDTLLARVGFDPQPDPPAFRGEMVLSALGGAGDDRLEVEMGAAPESRLPLRLEGTIDIDLHGDAGNDRLGFRAIQPSYLPESETRIGLFGDAGDDRIDVALDDPEIEGLFELAVLGGVGDDVLDSFIIPCIRPEGRANLLFDGEAGNDRVQVLLATEDDDDTGAFDVRVLGASGDDDLTLALMGVDELSFLSALVDGGRGFDTARVTRNVRVVNCEEVIFLDEPR